MSKLLQIILGFLAQIYLKRYKPFIIAVTGNVGKTSTKEAIAAVVKKIKRTRVSGGNLNNELGVPLTILGDWSEKYYREGSSFLFWLEVLIKGKLGIFYSPNYPEVLLLEYGADRPGDIKKLARRFKPHIAVVTAVGQIPVHIEYFAGPEEVAKEKSKLVEGLMPTDYAVLNFDDLAVLNMRQKTKAKVLTFGFGEGADVKISNFELRSDENGLPLGVGFKLNYQGSFVPVKIDGYLGKSVGYAVAAAAATGLIFGLNLVSISEALSSYSGPKGRLKILKGIKNSTIIDDTYNASPSSTHLALDTLKSLEVNPPKFSEGKFRRARKIAVLGDMLELGKYSIQAHQEIGNLAGNFVDLLVCVGAKAKFIADSAGSQMPKDKIFNFDVSTDARQKVQELIEEGDLVLIKGSQGMRMEKIVEEIMAEPERKSELLVRQSKSWLSK